MPKRIQRKRTKGWKMPKGAVYVGRPSCWGNPYKVVREGNVYRIKDANGAYCGLQEFDGCTYDPRLAESAAVGLFWQYIRFSEDAPDVKELRGKDLACWCSLDRPCHADVLLRLANGIGDDFGFDD